jgi:hypothetical protein
MKKFILNSLAISLLFVAFHAPQAHAAKMSLYPSSGQFNEGCQYSVDIIMNTEGANTRGADAFMSYNPNEIEILGIRPGWIFKSYPGRIFGGGDIKITAFSENGFYKGSGSLARLTFRSKPGVTSATISFKYSPGATTDSNVAGESANDILNGAYGAKYNFVKGPCFVEVPDTKPPYIKYEDLKPGMDWENLVPNTDIQMIIRDDKSGVDLDTVTVDINGTLYTKDGDKKFTYEGPNTAYSITIDPENDFILGEEEVTVKVNAEDLSDNVMDEFVYGFNAYEIPLEVLRAAAPECPELVCPEPECPTLISIFKCFFPWILLILLLISLAFNFKEYLQKQYGKLKRKIKEIREHKKRKRRK